MAREAALFQGISGGISLGGSSNAYTFTSPSGHALTAYPSHLLIVAKANHTNTGAATLNVDGLGTKSIVKSASTALASGDIVSGAIYLFSYDGTSFQILGSLGGASFQPLDADLTAIAALSTTSFGRSLLTQADAAAARTTLGGTVTGVSLFTAADAAAARTAAGASATGSSLFTAADAAAGRSTLGLGTAATVNTGTSGATIPLLNGANTWSGAQTFSADVVYSGTSIFNQWNETDGPSDAKRWFRNISGGQLIEYIANDANSASAQWLVVSRSGATVTTVNFPSGTLQSGGSTVWHAGNDGAGSTLDADLLDGLQGSAYGQLAANQTWSGQNTFTSDANRLQGAAGAFPGFQMRNTGDTHLSLGFGFDTSNRRIFINRWNTSTGAFIENMAFFEQDGDIWLSTLEVGGSLLSAIRIGSETSGTLTSASRNTQVHCSGNITLPASGMSDGDVLLIDPRGTARTITRPSGHTMYVNDSDVATATTPAHNLVSAKFCGGSKWVLQGAT